MLGEIGYHIENINRNKLLNMKDRNISPLSFLAVRLSNAQDPSH